MPDIEPATMQRLLELQEEDTALMRLSHRRESLPEAQQLTETNDRLAELEADLEIARKQHEEVAREQSRLEGEIEVSGQKIEREEQRLFSGAVSNPKELGALQAEVAMLKRQKATREDELLEVMVQKDQATETLQSIQREHDAAKSTSEALDAKVRELLGGIDDEMSDHEGKRSAIAQDIPSSLMATYEKIRAAKGGVGAAALSDGVCQGCHTKLPAKEIERIRAEGGLQRCDNCRRILVVAH